LRENKIARAIAGRRNTAEVRETRTMGKDAHVTKTVRRNRHAPIGHGQSAAAVAPLSWQD